MSHVASRFMKRCNVRKGDEFCAPQFHHPLWRDTRFSAFSRLLEGLQLEGLQRRHRYTFGDIETGIPAITILA